MFVDFNKKSSDLVSKDFPADSVEKRERRRFEYKSTSANGTGVTFTAFQKWSNDFDASLTLKKKCPKTEVVHELELKGDTAKITLTSEGKLHPEVKVIASGDVDPRSLGQGAKWGASVEAQFKTDVVGASFKGEQRKKDGVKEVTTSLAYTHNNVTVGVQSKTDAKPDNLNAFPEASFGVQHSTGDLVVGGVLTHTRGKEEGQRTLNLQVGFWQQFNPQLQFAVVTEVPISKSDGTPKVSAVAHRNLGNGESAKVRLVVPDGRVGLSYSAKFGSNVTLGLSADVNTTKIREGVSDETLAFGVKYSVSSE